jgi:hypothetical protein
MCVQRKRPEVSIMFQAHFFENFGYTYRADCTYILTHFYVYINLQFEYIYIYIYLSIC